MSLLKFIDFPALDDTYKKICEVTDNYLITKIIIINKNNNNLGLVSHFNKLVSMAKGEIIVVAAGDDISLSDRVSKTVDIFSKNKNITFVSFNEKVIDSNGNIISKGNRVKHKGIKA